MGSVLDLLKHLPEAAKSPLAFVAYCLVVAAWVLQQWLATKPQRDAKAILNSFKDDKARLAAIGQIFNEPPPHGLKGNEAILEWVKTRSSDKTKMLLVVAWLATLVAILIFLVAARNASGGRKISIQFHRTTGTHSTCPLPMGARVAISINSRKVDDIDIVNCEASLPSVQSQTGRATLSLSNSDPYKLFDSAHEYELAAEKWDVYIQGPLQITLFNYSGQCSNLARTFDTFEALIRSKANSLRGMFSADDRRFDYLATLNVVRTGDEFILSNEEANKYWQRTGSLQLLTGLCKSFPSGDVMQSMIFFGELKGELPSESFVTDLQVNPSEFGKTRDLHTASILYALAQEARDRQVGQDVVIDYLSEARTIAGEIASSGEQLRDAIDRSLREANAPKPMEQLR